jgi:hypothetical protein
MLRPRLLRDAESTGLRFCTAQDQDQARKAEGVQFWGSMGNNCASTPVRMRERGCVGVRAAMDLSLRLGPFCVLFDALRRFKAVHKQVLGVVTGVQGWYAAIRHATCVRVTKTLTHRQGKYGKLRAIRLASPTRSGLHTSRGGSSKCRPPATGVKEPQAPVDGTNAVSMSKQRNLACLPRQILQTSSLRPPGHPQARQEIWPPSSSATSD